MEKCWISPTTESTKILQTQENKTEFQLSAELQLAQRNKEIKDYLEFNKNEYTTFPNKWDTMMELLSGKFILLNVLIKKLERPDTSQLISILKDTEQKESGTPKKKRR